MMCGSRMCGPTEGLNEKEDEKDYDYILARVLKSDRETYDKIMAAGKGAKNICQSKIPENEAIIKLVKLLNKALVKWYKSDDDDSDGDLCPNCGNNMIDHGTGSHCENCGLMDVN